MQICPGIAMDPTIGQPCIAGPCQPQHLPAMDALVASELSWVPSA